MHLLELCWRLRLRERIILEWASKGLIRPEHSPDDWSLSDAIRIVVLNDIADAGLPVEALARYVGHLRSFKNDRAMLVIAYEARELIPCSPRGSSPPKQGTGPKVVMPGVLTPHIVPARELSGFLDCPDRRVGIVLPLDAIEERVKRVWPQDLAIAS